MAQIAQSLLQNLTGQQLSYKRSANLQIVRQQELRYNAPAAYLLYILVLHRAGAL
jgi:hypothetical protein